MVKTWRAVAAVAVAYVIGAVSYALSNGDLILALLIVLFILNGDVQMRKEFMEAGKRIAIVNHLGELEPDNFIYAACVKPESLKES